MISWPAAYYLVWVPLFDRYVVTYSADGSEAMGYADFALGSFARGVPIEASVKAILIADWQSQRREWEQERWECFMSAGLISESTANQWADEAWEVEHDSEEDEDEEIDEHT